MILTSKQNLKIKNLKKLQTKKFRNLEQKFLISGEHLINEALKHNLVLEIFETSDSKIYENATKVSYEIIKYLSQTTSPQKVLALCDKTKLKRTKVNKIIALNNLQDPGNVGTIMRLALAFGFDTIIIENLDPYNDKVLRASQGAIFNLNIIETKDLASLLVEYKTNNFKIYASMLDLEARKLNDIEFASDKLIILLGNEGGGISEPIKSLADQSLYIPIAFESLNVAVAAGIILDKIYNKRN